MPLCYQCRQGGFCRRWFITGDHELTNQAFVREARVYVRAWMLARSGRPSQLIEMILAELCRLNDDFRNGAWTKVELDFERLFEIAEATILFDANRAAAERAVLVDWLNDQFGDDWPEDRPTFFHRSPNGKGFAMPGERFRAITSAIRCIEWNRDPQVRHWGEEAPQAANDNAAEIQRGPFTLDD